MPPRTRYPYIGDVGNLSGGGSAPAMTERGLVQPNTAYAPGDVVVLVSGRRALIKTTVTSGASPARFISASNYVALSSEDYINAKEWGAKGNGDTNGDDYTALQEALNAAAATSGQTTFGGRTVFLPSGMYLISQELVIPPHVTLLGEGMRTTNIKLKTNSNCNVIRAQKAVGGGRNGDAAALMNLTIDGNRNNQSGAGPYHGIVLETNPTTTASSGDPFFDMHQFLFNVCVYTPKGDGVHMIGRSATQLMNVFVYYAERDGIVPTFDTQLSHCESDAAGRHGIHVNNGSVRITATKGYLSGQIDKTGAGIYLGPNASGCTVSSFEAQNNAGPGIVLNGAKSCTIQATSDSNNKDSDGGTHPAVQLIDADNNIITVGAWQGFQSGVQVGDQRRALAIDNNSRNNTIIMSHSARGSAVIEAPLTADSVVHSTNDITINGVSLTRNLDGLIDVQITNPLDGHSLVYDGAIGAFRNSAAGSASFAAGAYGDGTDGAATLDGTATVAWAVKSGSVYTMSRDAHLTALTIDAGVTLKPGGNRVFCAGVITNNGTIDASGNAGNANGTAGADVGRAALLTVAGGAGNTGAGSAANAGVALMHGMGSSGAGGSGSSGAGGGGVSAGSGNTQALRNPQPVLTGAMAWFGALKQVSGGPSGGGGAGDGTNKGGGGGGGGGIFASISHSFINAGTITVRGGDGGTPPTGNCGGGAAGSGGLGLIYTRTPWTNTGTLITSAGTPGAGVGTGTAGAAAGAGSISNFVMS